MSNQKMREALDAICSAKLCSINSMSSRVEMLMLMDLAIDKLREALAAPAAPVVPEGWRKAIEHVVEVWKNSNRYPDEADMPHLNRAINGIEFLLSEEALIAADRAARAEPVAEVRMTELGKLLSKPVKDLPVGPLYTAPPAAPVVPEGWNEVMDMLTGFEPIVMTSSSYGGSVFRVELGFRNLVDRNKGHDFLLKLIHFRDLLAGTKQSGGEG